MISKPRARGLGIPFLGEPGKFNAITDVPGVTVGYATIKKARDDSVKSEDGAGIGINTGVTAIFPRGMEKAVSPASAGFFSLNGNGEMTGTTWIEECGALTSPITITNTHAIGVVHRAVIDWTNANIPQAEWMLPCVAETFDGYLHDINGDHIKREHVFEALDSAKSGFIEEGSVGGGTGMNCYGYKAGSGTSSRVVVHGTSTYHVGVFVQANFGRRHELSIAGVYLGEMLREDNPLADMTTTPRFDSVSREGSGSVIAIVATDAPMLPNQCKAMARRVSMGLARTGTCSGHFSGDIFLAFSTANEGALSSNFSGPPTDDDYESIRFIPWGHIDQFYEAIAYATEEAVVNALVASEETIGFHGNRSPGFPIDRVLAALRERGVLVEPVERGISLDEYEKGQDSSLIESSSVIGSVAAANEAIDEQTGN